MTEENKMPEFWVCEKKTHLPEHDGATGYYYYEPVFPFSITDAKLEAAEKVAYQAQRVVESYSFDYLTQLCVALSNWQRVKEGK